MRKSVFKLLAALALLLACSAGALYAMFGSGARFHLEQADCAACHLAGKDVAADAAGMLTASQEALCGKCHLAAIQVSHPSGLQPARTPPAAYPLDWKGDLTCSTCHAVHASGKGLMRGSKTGKEFCFMCHAAGFFNNMRDGGASLLAGHLARGVAPGAPTLDPYSLKCMECHGNNANPRLSTGIDRNGVVRHTGGAVNHPIGMSYQKALAYGGYRPLRTVERKLLLPDGRMSCVSCHGGYQKEHGTLLVANAGSALCYQCHDL